MRSGKTRGDYIKATITTSYGLDYCTRTIGTKSISAIAIATDTVTDTTTTTTTVHRSLIVVAGIESDQRKQQQKT